MKDLAKRFFLIVSVLLACVGCDQSTKFYAESSLPMARALSFWGDTARLQLTYNEGAFLGLGASSPKGWRTAALRFGVATLLAALFVQALRMKTARTSLLVGLSLVLAGGVGNLMDRVLHDGRVVDFINLGIGSWRTGIFNVADMAIMAGALLLVLPAWRRVPPSGAAH